MKLKIYEIRNILKKNNYLLNKNLDIDDIKTSKQYEFICENKHIFKSLVSNVFQSGEFRCPICSNRRVLKGYNDLWSTHPHIANMLKDKEDGYKYTFGSNVKLNFICPDCKNEKKLSPNKIISQKSFCNKCNSCVSYSEKFIMNLLEQFSIYYEKEKTFSWSNKKRYDFYIPQFNCIVETHGKQHYNNTGFSHLGGRTSNEEFYNDINKQFLAEEYGKISNYIIIDCSKSNIHHIKYNILKSGLLDILHIFPYSVDWEECDEFTYDNINKLICNAYEEHKNLNLLCKEFNYSLNTIKEKLKRGYELGWCSYDINTIKKSNYENNGLRIKKTMSKPVIQMTMEDKEIKEFPSIQEAQRQLKTYHIGDCVLGKRNSSGGYKWRYKNEFN